LDTIWILKGKNAAQVDFLFFSFSMSSAWWTCLCEIVKIFVCWLLCIPPFWKAIKPGYILKYWLWIETDLNNWNVGMDWHGTANTWSVENYVGGGRIVFPISNFVISIFSVLNLLWTPAIMHWWHYFFFHIVSVRWKFRPTVMSVIVEFSLIWTTDY
jgi:hypothetical protein